MAGDGESSEVDAPEESPSSEEEPRRTRSLHRRPPARRPPVERWQSSSELFGEVDGEDDAFPVERPPRPKREPVFWRARDSLYFEPLVALAVIVVLLVSLFAYTSNWPPVYVVESNSMQHGPGDHLGALNAGDVVLAEKLRNASITTWIVGLHNGFSTYGSGGDVLLYHPNGTGSVTPVVHRALLYLSYNRAAGAYNASIPAGTTCGNASGAVYSAVNTPNDCGTTDLKQITLFGVGWHHSLSLTIQFTFGSLGNHSGYLTMGDNNSYSDQYRSGAFAPISSLVMPAWIIGVARGLIPWFGALKLALDGNSGLVPSASWELMGLTIAGVILAAAGVHWVFRREGFESPWRRRSARARKTNSDEVEEEAPPRAKQSTWPGLRPWRDTEDGAPADTASARRGGAGKAAARTDAKKAPAGKLLKFPHRLPRRRPDRTNRDDERL